MSQDNKSGGRMGEYGERKVKYIDIDKLGIDKCNIREGIWDADPELVNSIKETGILEPLIVRPIPPTSDGKCFGIVCGSRRYNAAVEAGLKKIPCIIKEMDDRTAREFSMIENRQRRETPMWMDIEFIGLNYDDYRREGYLHEEALQQLEKTGISRPTLERYLRIYQLPAEIKGLLREPQDRTIWQKEYIMRVTSKTISKTLSLGNADHLSRIKNLFPLEKLMEIAIFFVTLPEPIVNRITDKIVKYPNKSVEEIYSEVIKKEFKTKEKVLRFDLETWKAIEEACMDKQMHVDKFLRKVIKKALVREGYLKQDKLIVEEVSEKEKEENQMEVRASFTRLRNMGYKFLKESGDIKILQCPTKDGHGCFFKAYNKGRVTIITLTNPLSYKNPKERLLQEKRRLEKRE